MNSQTIQLELIGNGLKKIKEADIIMKFHEIELES